MHLQFAEVQQKMLRRDLRADTSTFVSRAILYIQSANIACATRSSALQLSTRRVLANFLSDEVYPVDEVYPCRFSVDKLSIRRPSVGSQLLLRLSLFRDRVHSRRDLRLVAKIVMSQRLQILIELIHQRNTRRNIELHDFSLA